VRRAIVVVASLLLASAAQAYDQQVHVYLSERGYKGPASIGASAPADASAVRALRARIWRAGSQARDAAVKKRFLLRWPNEDAFDAWAFKQLFALNPEVKVAGFDDEVFLPDTVQGAIIFGAASRRPDDDGRNRDRFAHDANHVVPHDRWGRPLPDDPATLEMGSLTGLSSQAHAPYGLPRLAFSEEPSVLKSDPRRFAVPATVHTFGAAFADSYTELAVLAARDPEGQRLSLVLAGAAAHHLEDVANQIHTVQVGLYDFFVDAKLQAIQEDLLSVGGVLRPRPGFVSIGLDIISNHHLLAESLYQKHLLREDDPVGKQTAAAPADDELTRAFAQVPAGCTHGFGRALAEALIDRSSYEGPEVYKEIRRAAQGRWSHAGVHFTEQDNPDEALRENADLTRFYQLEATGARRAIQTLEAWWTRFEACRTIDATAEDALAEALVSDRLDALDASEARRRMWTAQAPAQEARNWWVLVGYVTAIVLLAWLLRRILRRRRPSS
jgi:hypothetical protein